MRLDRVLREGGAVNWFCAFIDCFCLFFLLKISIFSYQGLSFFPFFSIHFSYVLK